MSSPLRLVYTVTLALLIVAPALDARITRIVIDKKVSPAFAGAAYGEAGQYETIAGRAYGTLDPRDPKNAIIQDLNLAPKNSKGLVEYMATFFLVKPVDMARASGFLWHDVPNRGGRITIPVRERNFGDIGLSSGWQGDNAGGTAQKFPNTNDYVVVPKAINPDGTPVTGRVVARIVNRSGAESQPVNVQGNPMPWKPSSLDTSKATLVSRTRETATGQIVGERVIPSTDWAWARCSFLNPFPGTPDPSQICLKNGFTPNLVYQVAYTAQDPLVLGIGFAAYRDMAAFFKHAEKDDEGTPNPVARRVRWSAGRGRSQSGNFLRALLHLGFNQDEAGKQLHDALWPFIAGRRVALNYRWAQPDGTLEMYQIGIEGPQWWAPFEDKGRNLRQSSLLSRCTATKTCPKIFEVFGAAEIWGLKYGPGLTGTTNQADIPLPPNVRRYYMAGSSHGGGPGGFEPPPAALPACSGNNFGSGILPRNPMPHTETENALNVHFRKWVMTGEQPPQSRYPRLADGTLVENTKAAMGFPTLPQLPATAPTGLVSQLFDYDWGPGFNVYDASGVPANVPPSIRKAWPSLVPKVDADGNELGGVPVVLRDAPLGTYLGWNITSAGFHKDKICGYTGGMIPFARTRTERERAGDPRLSLEERYTDHAGYVRAVREAATRAVASGFLLRADAEALIAAAQSSKVLLH